MAKNPARSGNAPATPYSRPKTASMSRDALEAELRRLTSELGKANSRAEQAKANELAALDLLEEVSQSDNARKAKAEAQLADLHRAIADAEQRKTIAEGIATQAREATDNARKLSSDATNDRKEAERKLREINQDIAAAQRDLNYSTEDLLALRKEVARLEAEAASYGITEHIPCGCQLLVKRGPDCAGRALVTAISPCGKPIPGDDFEIEDVIEALRQK